MKNGYLKLGGVCAVIVLTGFSCPLVPEIPEVNVDTNVEVPADPSLLDVIDTVGASFDEDLVGTWILDEQVTVGVTHPFSGRMLTIEADGSFTEEWEAESSDRAPNCSVSGENVGSLLTESGSMFVDRSTTANPIVTCTGALTDVTATSGTGPLGVGPVSMVGGEPQVEYTYEIDNDTLVVELASPQSTFTFTRQ